MVDSKSGKTIIVTRLTSTVSQKLFHDIMSSSGVENRFWLISV